MILYTIASTSATGRSSAAMLVDHGYQFTLTALADGRLLAVGGNPASGGLTAAAEIFDWRTGTWSLTGSLNTARGDHSATLLPDGRVLIAGGYGSGQTLTSAEVYDPQTGTFSLVGSMSQKRQGHSAFLLANGKVLVVTGAYLVPGVDTFGLASAELFDPASGTWTPTGSLEVARMNQGGTRLADGRVLVAGGQDRGVTFQNFNSAELYDPASGTWSRNATTMVTARRGGFKLTTLASGKVLVAGGITNWTGPPTANAELFDPATGVWTPTSPLPAAVSDHTATLLEDGKVLIAGGLRSGTSLDTGYLFNPATQLWTATTNPLNHARGYHAAVGLPGGPVLLAGGFNGTTTVPSAEIYGASRGIYNVPPAVNAGADATVRPGVTFTQTGSLTDPGADVWSATVDYGDGSGVQPLTLNADKTFTLSHVFPAGNYSATVTVTVTDDDGGSGVDTFVVAVDDAAPVLESFVRQAPATSPTDADTLVFLATFSEAVAGVSVGDFEVHGATTASVTGVTPVTGNTYDVTVSGGDLVDFLGTVGLNVANGQNILDLAGNALPTAEPGIDETYTVTNGDVTVSIPDDLLGAPGVSVTVPVRFAVNNLAGVTISGFDIVIEFDATKFSVGSAQLGALLAANSDLGGELSAPAAGKVIFSADATVGSVPFAYGTQGDLFTIVFEVAGDAPAGDSPLNLLASFGETPTAMFANDIADLRLLPGPTDASDDSVDGLMTIDATPPTLAVNIVDVSLSDENNSSSVTFTFSEAVTGFTADDVTVAGGTLSDFTGSGSSYSATFTATDSVETTGSVSVAAGSSTDVAGNLGGAGTDSVTIDTRNPAVTVTRQSTADTTPLITGTVDDPAAAIAVRVDGQTYPAVNRGDGTWTLANDTITPALAAGVFDILVTVTDAAGNVGSDGTTGELEVDPHLYFVNDSATANDVWSLAAGNDAHDGRTPYTPKATLQALIDAYDLEPGDVVRVDTGTYNLTSDVLLGSDDSGSATGYVTILGSVQGTVLNRQSTASGANAIQLDGQDYIRLQNLHLTGGQDGLYISSHTKHYEIRDCAIYGNSRYGVYSPDDHFNWDTPTILLQGCLIYGNASGGAVFATRANASTVENCTFYGNGGISLNGAKTARNNIVYASGSGAYAVGVRSDGYTSDYNNLFATGGAQVSSYGDLSDLRTATGQEAHSLSSDPLLANPTDGDFHLNSNGGRYDPSLGLPASDPAAWVIDPVTSPSIDAGDPATAVGAEPAPHGARVNQGAYGRTAEASKTDLTAPAVSAWLVTDDTGVNSTDGITRDATPVLTFHFSEVVLGTTTDVQVSDPTGDAVLPDVVTGWGSATLTVTFSPPLTEDGVYQVTLKGTSTIRDMAGNALNGGSDEIRRFTIDTQNPTVSDVTAGDLLLTDADVGSGKLTVTVVFSEPMAATPAPTLTFSPAVGTTLTMAGGTWTDTTHYAATYDVADANFDVDAVQIGVTGAKDAAGNVQQAYTPADEFEIDTANPAVLVLTPADDSVGGPRDTDLTITFSEPIQKGAGTIVVRKSADGSAVESIDVSNAAVTVAGTTATITLAGLLPGSMEFYVEVAAGAFEDLAGNDFAGISGPAAWNFNTNFIVTGLTATSTGFHVRFSQDLDLSQLNLYDQGNLLGAADVTLIGATVGKVRGSFVVGPGSREATFIKTSGLLPPDQYTVTLTSSATAFRDVGGSLLDGDGNGQPGGDFVNAFAVLAPATNAITVSLPNITRGYGQPVNLPANVLTAGLPVQLSDGLGLSGLDLELHYNPSLLNITAFTLDSGVTARGGAAQLTFSSAGVARLTVDTTGSLGATSGLLTLGSFTAAVPNDALYGAKHILDISNLRVYDNGPSLLAVPSIGDDAIHVAAYFGDTNGGGFYNSPDSGLVRRIIGQLNTGLAAYALADPMLIADITLNGVIQSNDTTSIRRAMGGIPVPNIPALPTGLDMPAIAGADPKLTIPRNLAAAAGTTLTVPVVIEVTEPAGVTIGGFDIGIEFDPDKFTVSQARLGDLFQGTDLVGVMTQPSPGRLVFSADSLVGTTRFPFGTVGHLVTLTVTVAADAAPGLAAFNLLATLGLGRTGVFDANLRELVLNPAPTNAASDPVDGLVAIGSPNPIRHNAANPLDANGDGLVTALDALLVINSLNAALDAPAFPYVAAIPAAWCDVNNDQVCTSLDVLLLVNHLNTQASPAAEGEPSGLEETPAAVETFQESLFADLEAELSPFEDILSQLADDVASAWR